MALRVWAPLPIWHWARSSRLVRCNQRDRPYNRALCLCMHLHHMPMKSYCNLFTVARRYRCSNHKKIPSQPLPRRAASKMMYFQRNPCVTISKMFLLRKQKRNPKVVEESDDSIPLTVVVGGFKKGYKGNPNNRKREHRSNHKKKGDVEPPPEHEDQENSSTNDTNPKFDPWNQRSSDFYDEQCKKTTQRSRLRR